MSKPWSGTLWQGQCLRQGCSGLWCWHWDRCAGSEGLFLPSAEQMIREQVQWGVFNAFLCKGQDLAHRNLDKVNDGLSSAPPSLESGHSSPVGGHKLTWFYSDLAMNCWGLISQKSMWMSSVYITSFKRKLSLFSPGLCCRFCHIISCYLNCCQEKHTVHS